MTTSLAAAWCDECGAEIAPGLLACPGCARLLHRDALVPLAAAAEQAERDGDLSSALASWRRAIELLPPQAGQRIAIEQRMQRLGAALDGRAGRAADGARGGGNKAKAGAAGAGAVGLALLKSKALLAAVAGNAKLLLLGLTKLPTLLSMLVFARWSGGGTLIGVGVVASIYVHEVGHVAALRRYGIDASAPMFVPGFGAFVRMKQYPTDAHEDARTGLAGPLWGLFAAAVAAALGAATGSRGALAVASIGATINLFNLIPFWQLDGARGLRALARGERIAVAIAAAITGLALHEWTPLAVAVVAGGHAFARGAHPTGDRRVLALYVALVVAHALLATLPIAR